MMMSLSDAASAYIIAKLFDVMQTIGSQVRGGSEILLKVSIEPFGIRLFEIAVGNRAESFSLIYKFAAAVVSIVLIKVIFVYGREYVMSSVQQKILMRFRQDLFETVVALPVRYFDRNKTGQIMSRITNDVSNLEQSLSMLVEIAQNAVYSVVFASALFFVSWQLTLVTVFIFALSGEISRRFGDRIRRFSRELTNTVADISSFLQEKISSIRIVKSFAREEFEKQTFKRRTEANYHFSMKIVRVVALLSPTNELFGTAATSLLVVFTGYLFVQGTMTIESMLYFLILMINLSKPVKSLGESAARIQKTLVSAGLIFEMIDLEREPSTGTTKLTHLKEGKVEFRNVSMVYNDSTVALKRINVVVEAGKKVALVGPSGGGKSSFINLLPRFYDASEGEVLIDGLRISVYGLHELRNSIGIVPQDVLLFSGTVTENIRYGRLEARDDEIVEAARSANAHEFIQRLEKGYATELGERGVQLSGGQRQRLAIARTILRNPKILLLDEATSALDTESEQLVQQALNRLMQNRTTFVIAHRLSTIADCDRILVLHHGEIVEQGTQDELLANPGGLFRKLYELQFRDEVPSTTEKRAQES